MRRSGSLEGDDGRSAHDALQGAVSEGPWAEGGPSLARLLVVAKLAARRGAGRDRGGVLAWSGELGHIIASLVWQMSGSALVPKTAHKRSAAARHN